MFRLAVFYFQPWCQLFLLKGRQEPAILTKQMICQIWQVSDSPLLKRKTRWDFQGVCVLTISSSFPGSPR